MDINIPEGYKQTEVGVIPKDWEIYFLGDKTIKIGSGITPTGGAKVYKKEGRPFLRSQNVGWGQLSLDDIAYIDDVTHDTFKATEIRDRDVFLNITGASIGRSAVADKRVVNGNVNQHVCIIRPIDEELDSYFLNYFLLSKKGQKQIDAFQAGGNRQGLNFRQIKSFKVPLPPTIEEQKAIAQSLSDVDVLIAECDRIITKKRNTKQGAMQQLLTGKKRLPGFSGEWEVKKLGEIGECIIGLTYKPENVKESGLLVLRSSNIGDNQLKFEDNVFVDIEVPEKLITKEGDILICVRNGSRQLIGKNALIDKDFEGLTFGAFMSVYITEFYQYVFHAFQSNNIKKQINENIGATINQITNKNLNSFEILLPSLEEQKAIAQILSDMDAQIAALEQKRDKYKVIKQGMMQKLLTGKTRLITNC